MKHSKVILLPMRGNLKSNKGSFSTKYAHRKNIAASRVFCLTNSDGLQGAWKVTHTGCLLSIYHGFMSLSDARKLANHVALSEGDIPWSSLNGENQSEWMSKHGAAAKRCVDSFFRN